MASRAKFARLARYSRIWRGESHFSRKWPLASVGESGESVQHGSASVGESGESTQHGSANVIESGESSQHSSANVVESGESAQHGLANVGESGESQHQHKTRRKHSREYSRHSQNLHSQNSLLSGHCLV
jgi:hypothetical protein